MHCEYGGQAVLVAEDNNARRNSDLAERRCGVIDKKGSLALAPANG